jgi:hypothetical protein
MNKHRSRRISIMAAVAALFITAAFAQEFSGGGSFDLSWNTIDGGGGASAGGSFEVAGSIGQPDASSVALAGGGFELAGGFWPAADTLPHTPGDVNGDGEVNIDDLLGVINAWGICPPPCPADVDGNGMVNIDDLLFVINHWG